MKFTIIALVSCIIFPCFLWGQGKDPLYPGLANELKKINEQGSYHKWPSHGAGKYLGSIDYTAEEYEDFFRRFFKENPKLTSGFTSFIGYALFGWFSDEARSRSQGGVCPVVLDLLLEYSSESAEKTSARMLAEYKDKNENYQMMAGTTHQCILKGHGLHAEKFAPIVAKRIKEHIKTHPFLNPSTHVDMHKLPLFNSYRYMFLLTLAEIERDNPNLAQELGYTGLREEIWRKHKLFVVDNATFSETKGLKIINNILDGIPHTLHQLRGITVRDNIEADGEFFRGTSYLPGCVNIFGESKGMQTENSFPVEEVKGRDVDQFSLVVIHEVNHYVDARTVNRNKKLFDQKMALIKEAGRNTKNYLRDGGDGFFFENPQEFFASISNQYVADSALTFELGYVRCRKGNLHPMKQALFFLSVYTEGDTARSYMLDEYGNLKVDRAKLKKDASGKVLEVQFPNKKRYMLNYDGNGNLSGCMRI